MLARRHSLLLASILLVLIAPSLALAQGDLTQTYVSPNQKLTLRYPDGWYATDFMGAGIVLGTFEDGVSALFAATSLASGERIVLLIATPDLPADAPLRNAKSLGEVLDEARSFGDFGAVTELMIGDYPAALAEGTAFQASETDAVIIAIDLGNGTYVQASGMAAKGELAELEAQMKAILATVQYDTGAATGESAAVENETTATTEAPTAVPRLSGPIEPAQLWSVQLRGNGVQDLAFSPDDTIIAASGSSGSPNDIALLNAPTGELIRQLSGHTGVVNRLEFSPDGQTLASASDDGTVRLWNVASGAETLKLDKGTEVTELAFSPKGDRVAFITDQSPDGVWVLEIASGEDRNIDTLDDSGNGLAFSPDGSALLVNAANHTESIEHTGTWLWDIDATTATITTDHEGESLGTFFLPDATPLIALMMSDTKEVRIGDVSDNTLLATLFPATTRGGDTVPTVGIAIDPSGRLLARAAADAEATVWNVQQGLYEATLNRDQSSDGPLGFAFSHDGSWLAVSYEQGAVELWRLFGEGLPPAATLSAVTDNGATSPTTEANTSTATCTISAPQNANLRGGPGTSFARAGTLAAGQTAEVDGQAKGADGMTWLHITTDAWVRGDVVSAPAECASVPAATP